MDFESFYTEWRGRVFGYLVRMTGNRELAADIMQESFTRCFARNGDIENPKAFLFTVARNLVCDHHRKAYRERDREDLTEPAGPDPEAEFMVRERARRTLSALARLPETEREVLALAAEKSLTYREIALVCGISEAAVKVRVHRARRKLISMLEEKP